MAEGRLREIVLAIMLINALAPALGLRAKEPCLFDRIAAILLHKSVVYGVQVYGAARLTEGSLEEARDATIRNRFVLDPERVVTVRS